MSCCLSRQPYVGVQGEQLPTEGGGFGAPVAVPPPSLPCQSSLPGGGRGRVLLQPEGGLRFGVQSPRKTDCGGVKQTCVMRL